MLVSLLVSRLWSPLTSLLLGSSVVTRQGVFCYLLVAADSNITHYLMTPSAVQILTESSHCLQVEAAPRKVGNDMEMQHLT